MIGSKRAVIRGNVISLIIAVLGFLVVLGVVGVIIYSLYYSDAAKAKQTLDIVIDKIDYLNPGEVAKFPLRGVDGWALAGWDKDNPLRPDKCFLSSCICVCPNVDVGGLFSSQGILNSEPIDSDFFYILSRKFSSNCQEGGFCKNIKSEDVFSLDEVSVEGSGHAQLYRGAPFIITSNNLIEIQINNSKELSIISSRLMGRFSNINKYLELARSYTK